MPKGGDLLSVQTWKVTTVPKKNYHVRLTFSLLQDSLMEDLIMHAHILYDENTNHSSPPLPPTPAGEPVPHYAYGSKSTKIASVPPSTPNASGSHVPSSPQDFTPRLPPRPANSIHPSLRANPQTPTRGRAEVPGLPIRHGNRSPEETPPPSPSISSTFNETDESTYSEQESFVSQQPTAQAVALRSMSPLRPNEPIRPDTPSQPDPTPPPPVV